MKHHLWNILSLITIVHAITYYCSSILNTFNSNIDCVKNEFKRIIVYY